MQNRYMLYQIFYIGFKISKISNIVYQISNIYIGHYYIIYKIYIIKDIRYTILDIYLNKSDILFIN